MEDNDRSELTGLVTRLGAWLDEKRFDEARSVLTEDVVAETVGGTSRGIDAVTAQARRHHEVPTQHLITDPRIDVDGDHATIKANVLVVFVRPDGLGVYGEIYVLDAVRTADGWRISHVRGRPLWNTELPHQAHSETGTQETRSQKAGTKETRTGEAANA
ncbi:nuclear transport factor 2 family protein [Actinomadura macra]|uniref:nuclear transport factor 2 family protein n=1 Tax=Actinomadura macra TaxID=46164 RepID=UPI000834A38C|nr:nuclear transport factor 2 family protein [Actinomadura macra]